MCSAACSAGPPLPREWADDPARRATAGVPDDIVFQTKQQIAPEQLRWARAAGIEAEVALLCSALGFWDTVLKPTPPWQVVEAVGGGIQPD